MSIESIMGPLQEKAKSAAPLGNTLKFDFGDEKVYIDGTGDSNDVTAEDKDADCVVIVSMENFQALASGDLNPMTAMMTGKMKIKGDMGVAMKLQSLI